MQFVQWLPSKVEEFQNKTPEEIVGKLNELAQTEDGMNTISGLINQFKQEQSAGMFKQGGKLAYLVNKFKDGGSIPVEHRINPRNLGSFFQEGGKTTTKVKVNPNDSVAVTKALNNRTGDHNVHNVFNTTGLVRDSLIKIGYNPVMVNRIANPIISNAERKLDEFAPEQYTPRQQNLLKFLHPTGIPYWANGTADTEQAKSNGYKSERIINSNGSIREIVTNPKGKRSYRDISADKRDTTYTNDLSSMSRSNNPKWWKFRDKKVERQEYDKRDKAFNKRFNLK